MPNDAKLGLVVGVGLVIAVAVLFYRKEPQTAPPRVKRRRRGSSGPCRRRLCPAVRSAPLRPTPRPGRSDPAAPTPRPVVIRSRRATRCSASLAAYYGDAEKFRVIYQANRDVLREPDPLPVGVDLVIPDVAGAEERPESG